MLIHSNNELIIKYQDYIRNNNHLIFFSPYIKISALKKLLIGQEDKVNTIVTSWKLEDILKGSSDLEVYPYCLKYGIQLLINQKIHLKAITNYNMSSCIISSANITNSGLAISKKCNIELGTIVNNLELNDQCYFDRIVDDSILVTEDLYSHVKKKMYDFDNNKLAESYNLLKDDMFSIEYYNLRNDKYLTSQLPYFDRPQNLYDVITNQDQYSIPEIRNAFHDIQLYKVYESSDKANFKNTLKFNFLNSQFIRNFLLYNGEGNYFGKNTSWLHNRIQDVPSPTRLEIKEYQKRIYAYIEYLLDSEYIIERPRYSQLLRRIN